MENLRKSKKVWIALIILLILIPVSFYYYNQYKNNQNLLLGGQAAGTSQQLVQRVGQLVVLPQGQPTIATVSDASKLPNQPFFANAQNGDKVLIYSQVGEAILYRPSINKIVNMGLVNLVANPTPSLQTQEVTPSSVLVTPKLLRTSSFSAQSTQP